MHRLILGCLLAFATSANPVLALSDGDLPNGTAWYLHLDLLQMDSTVTGKHLSDWMNEEIFEEIEEDTGIDLSRELDAVTVFSDGRTSKNGAIVLHGDLSKKTKDSILELLRSESAGFDEESISGVSVYSFTDIDFDDDHSSVSITTDERAYLAFGTRGQTLLTQSESMLKEWANSGGRIKKSSANYPGALIVLHADRSLIKGGVRGNIGRHHAPWNSSIAKNMEQVAIILFDEAGKAALDVNIITNGPETAESLNNVVKGLIALKSLAADDEPELSALLEDTDVELVGSSVTIKARLDAQALMDFLD